MKASYGSVIKFLEIIDESERNERGAKAAGLLNQIQTWDFLFYIYTLNAVFETTDILNKSLQARDLDIATALVFAELTISKLKQMKNDKEFFKKEIFDPAVQFAEEFSIIIPTAMNRPGRPSKEALTKKRRRDDVIETIETLEEADLERFKTKFDEITDIFVNHLSAKFDTDNYKPLIAIQNLLTSSEKPELSTIFFDMAIYREDYDIDNLNKELDIWYSYKLKYNLNDIKSIHEHFCCKNLKSVFPNILVLLTIFLTVPVTSCESERSFSVLKRLKSWLRSTMSQVRLTNLTIIHIHSRELMNLSVNSLIDIFASNKKRRTDFF